MTTRLALPALPLLALLAAPAAAQDPLVREIQRLDTLTAGIGLNPSIASDGRLVAVTYYDGGSSGLNRVYVSTSDGRGTAWNGPVRVDRDPGAAGKIANWDACQVSGSNVYVVWKDERNGSSFDDVYFNRSTDGGQGFEPADVRLPDGYGGTGQVRTWRFAASPGAPGGHDYLHVVMASDANTTAPEECFLTWSADSGQTWNGPLQVGGDAGNGVNVDGIAVAASGAIAHVIWDDDAENPGGGLTSVHYRRFDAVAGALGPQLNLDLGDPLALGDSQFGGNYSFDIECEGDLVAAAWLEERLDASDEELRVAVSLDGGLTWGPDELVGGYDVAQGHDVDFSALLVAGGSVYVAYTDNRVSLGTLDHAYVSVLWLAGVSGLPWVESPQLSDALGAGAVRLAGDGQDVAVTWTTDASGNQYTGCALSWDAGFTWVDDFPVGIADGSVDADVAEIGWVAAYDNFVCAWLSNDVSTNNVYASGFRSPTLQADGWTGGVLATSDFELSRFLPQEANEFAVVLLAGAPATGQFVLPDGRDTGLANDALLQLSFQFYGFLAAPIAANGFGSTPDLLLDLPPGLTFHAVALGLRSGPATVDRITDVVRIDT